MTISFFMWLIDFWYDIIGLTVIGYKFGKGLACQPRYRSGIGERGRYCLAGPRQAAERVEHGLERPGCEEIASEGHSGYQAVGACGHSYVELADPLDALSC